MNNMYSNCRILSKLLLTKRSGVFFDNVFFLLLVSVYLYKDHYYYHYHLYIYLSKIQF